MYYVLTEKLSRYIIDKKKKLVSISIIYDCQKLGEKSHKKRKRSLYCTYVNIKIHRKGFVKTVNTIVRGITSG